MKGSKLVKFSRITSHYLKALLRLMIHSGITVKSIISISSFLEVFSSLLGTEKVRLSRSKILSERRNEKMAAASKFRILASAREPLK